MVLLSGPICGLDGTNLTNVNRLLHVNNVSDLSALLIFLTWAPPSRIPKLHFFARSIQLSQVKTLFVQISSEATAVWCQML